MRGNNKYLFLRHLILSVGASGGCIEGAQAMRSGDLVLSGAIWRKGVSQRRRAPLAGFPTWGRYRRLVGAALVFLYGDDLTSLDNSSMAAPQRLDHAHARDAHGRQIVSER